MKYCIGCKHLRYEDKEMGYGSTLTGAWTAADAALSCAKEHWRFYLTEGAVGFDFENAMRHAATCNDFQERPAPTGRDEHGQ